MAVVGVFLRFVSQVVALAVPIPVVTLAPSVCATPKMKPQRAPMPPSAMSRPLPASKRNLLRGMDEISVCEYVERQRINPYVNPRAILRGTELFWTKQHALIYLDVIKSKQNTFVDVKWIDMQHMRKEKFHDYFGEALDLVEQLLLSR